LWGGFISGSKEGGGGISGGNLANQSWKSIWDRGNWSIVASEILKTANENTV